MDGGGRECQGLDYGHLASDLDGQCLINSVYLWIIIELPNALKSRRSGGFGFGFLLHLAHVLPTQIIPVPAIHIADSHSARACRNLPTLCSRTPDHGIGEFGMAVPLSRGVVIAKMSWRHGPTSARDMLGCGGDFLREPADAGPAHRYLHSEQHI